MSTTTVLSVNGSAVPPRKSKNAFSKRCLILSAIVVILLGAGAAIATFLVTRNPSSSSQSGVSNPSGPVPIDPTNCEAKDSNRLEISENGLLLGFHLDWNPTLPINISKTLGFTPAVFNAFLVLDGSLPPKEALRYNVLNWHGEEARRVGGMLAITIEPIQLTLITEAHREELIKYCVKINSEYGVPLFLRWGHEMNSNWVNYGYQPTLYIDSFRKFTLELRKQTNMTAMVWGPNLGTTYPFVGEGLVRLPTPGSREFAVLDTNKDGVIDNKDDPYMPYYPGDEYVDWVAISLYWYTDSGTGYNRIPPATYFKDNLRSSGPGVRMINPSADGDKLKDFYGRFCIEHNKPLMIPETGASFLPGETGDSELQIKSAWYREIFVDASKDLPKLKIVTQFEEIKPDGQGKIRDWRVSNNTLVLKNFQDTIRSSNVVLGGQYKLTCNGKLVKI
jgi:hypothetical protein